MKIALRILGILAIVFALYVIVGEQLVGASGDAYVNARLSTVRAPIAGKVQLAPLALGGRVRIGDQVGQVNARPLADATLSQLMEGQLVAQADLNAHDQVESQLAGPSLGRELARFRAEAYAEAIRQRRVAVASESAAPLLSPVTGVLWSLNAATDEYVPEGGQVASVADCGNLYVHATVDQRIFNQLSTGDAAQFRLREGATVEATVVLLAGTGPRTLWETFAINPADRQLEGYAVLLTAPQILSDDTCPMGRTGRVVFSEGPLSLIGDIREWLGF